MASYAHLYRHTARSLTAPPDDLIRDKVGPQMGTSVKECEGPVFVFNGS